MEQINAFFTFKTEHSYKENPKLLTQLQYCEENDIPFCIIIGEDEIQKNVVKLKHVSSRTEEAIDRQNLLNVLKERLKK